MRKFILAALFCLISSVAMAQGCGPQNPNCVVPTRPVGDSTNFAASTAFVQQALSGGYYTDLVGKYGVKCDGVQDNSAKIQQAITDANVANVPAVLLLPVGHCLVPTLTATVSANNVYIAALSPGMAFLDASANRPLTWTGSFGGTYNVAFNNLGAATNVTISCQGFQDQFINAFLGTGVGTFWSADNSNCGSNVLRGTTGQVGTPAVCLITNNLGNGLTVQDSFIYTTGVRGSVTAGRCFISLSATASSDSIQVFSNYIQIFDKGVVAVTGNGVTTQNVFMSQNTFDGMNSGHSFTTNVGGITTGINLQDKWLGALNGPCISFDGAGSVENIVVTGKTGTCGSSGFISTVSGSFKNVLIDGVQFGGLNFASVGGTADGINIASGSFITITSSQVGQLALQANTQPKNGCVFGSVIDHLVFEGNNCNGTVTNYNGMLAGTTTTFAHTNAKQRGNVGLQDAPAYAVNEGGTGIVSGTSGGIPYFNSTTTMSSSGLLGANCLVYGGGAGATPATSASTCPTASAAGVLAVTNTTASTTPTTGSTTIAGGLGVTGSGFFGGQLVASYNANCFAALNPTNGVLACGTAKATTTATPLLYAASNDAASALVVQFNMQGDATAANRRATLQVTESGVAFRPFSLQEGGGNVTVGSANGAVVTAGDIFSVNGQGTFAGGLITKPTVVGSLPACNATTEGARAYVTDQNTAVAYRGAVTGSGSTRQAVLCSNSAWIQD